MLSYVQGKGRRGVRARPDCLYIYWSVLRFLAYTLRECHEHKTKRPGKKGSRKCRYGTVSELLATQATKLYAFLNGADTQYSAVPEWLGSASPDGEASRKARFAVGAGL